MSRLPTGTQNAPRSRRNPLPLRDVVAIALGCIMLAVPMRAANSGYHDVEFEKYPLDKWLTDGKQSRLKWHVEIPPPELSTHQRLMLKVVARVDGREIQKLRGNGDFITLLQVRDAAGHIWQNHAVLDVAKLPDNVQSNEFTIGYFAFVLPGDYTVTVAACGGAAEEHSLIVRKVHVPALHTDPLSGAWAGFPNVEFINPVDGPPDVWYLPEVHERLHVALQTSRPVHLQILVNTTPSERAAASVSTMRRNMSVAIPALKILSQFDMPGSTVDAALLDLTHRSVPFEQQDAHMLDWARLRNYFLDLKPGLIDVATLQGHWKMRRFFWDEVTRRLQPTGDAVPVVIVLSGPAFFDNQETVETVPSEQEFAGRLFYVRYRPPLVRPRVRVRPGMRPPPPVPSLDALPLDDLEHTLEPLGARIFDVTSAEQFRRVLAAIMDQISKI